jgi:O-antigen ligase
MELGGLFDFGDGINRIYFRSSIFFIIPFLYNLSLVLRREKSERKSNFAAYLFMSVSMCAIIITYTRSIWLGVLAAFVGFVIFNRKHIGKIAKGVGFTAIGVLVFVLLSWAAYGFEGVVYNAVSRISFNSEQKALENSDSEFEFGQRKTVIESDFTRADRLQALTEDIEQNWVWGCGFGDKVTVHGYEIKTEYTYIEILRKMGVFGSLAFLAMLLAPLIITLQRRKAETATADMSAVVAGAMLCIAAASIFNPYLTSPLGFSVYGVLAGCALLAERSPKAARYKQTVPASDAVSEQQDAM